MKISFLSLSSLLIGICSISTSAAEPGSDALCREQYLDINGAALWVDYEQIGPVTVVFEAGGGNDSSVWKDIVPEVQALSASTFVYDRAGLGKSAVDDSPYSIQREVNALAMALDRCHIENPIIMVAHSYGGMISQLFAAQDARVSSLVLLDAVVPGFYTPTRLDELLARYRPQYAQLRNQAPELARTMIPLMEAYPQSTAALDKAVLAEDLQLIDIVAEFPAENSPEDVFAWKQAHRDFVAADHDWEQIVAQGSSHNIAAEAPELVTRAITDMLFEINKPAP